MTEYGITELAGPQKADVEYLIIDAFSGQC